MDSVSSGGADRRLESAISNHTEGRSWPPKGTNIGQAVNDAMRAIEAHNSDLDGVLPKTYNRLSNDVLVALLKSFNQVPKEIEGDAFGRIYEYFLRQFAMGEGRRGGEFFTPTSIVRLIV